ncbi:Haloacid dehalogenase-like hydrolase domain-containing protein 3 [Durusdinium trenchii]|uniref:Haloacid dehalogenase-like hydrolase domain-containing protein 3 n=1 Tax=Durusdinium trenchii TaxID=1381693 RepID=A0ABP0RCK9_9DINO
MVPSLLLASCISFTLVAAEIKLPDGPIIAAWQNWGACNDTQTIQAVERGVNVVFWFSSNLVKDGDKPKISGPLPDLECVARVRKAIKEKGLPTAHLLSIGGWDAPHPDTSFTGTEWFHAWNEWNQGLPMPFDGFDWDLEGNDYLTSPYNVFSPACLQLVVDMSAAAKAAGYLVTMDYRPEFRYRGRNSYAYMWAAAPPGTFDLVSVQLYESYAPAMQALQEGISGEEYLQSWAAQFILGWTINFNDTSLKLQGHVDVAVPASHFLIGLSFGSPPRSAFFWPETAGAAYSNAPAHLRPRGYAFWMIGIEDSLANKSNRSLSFAFGLNSFLHVRKQGRAQLEKRSLR